MNAPLGRTARYYKSLRAAHLERAELANDGQLTFYGTGYYDLSSLRSVDRPLVEQCTPLQMVRRIKRLGIRTLEVNEPAQVNAWPDLVQILIGTCGMRRRGELELVTYAIANFPVEEQIFARLGTRSAIIGKISRWFASQIIRRMSRIAFGTSGAEALYEDLCVGVVAKSGRRFTALPRRSELDVPKKAPFSLVFVGAFDERKGIRLLMEAWPATSSTVSGSNLTVIGKGPLQAEVEEWCRSAPDATLIVDPPRHAITDVLRSASVLALLSQRVGGFREQIGLPILEGLAHGCTIVTTDETGIAAELTEAGHFVIPAGSSTIAVSRALTEALLNPLPPESVLSQLPRNDGRLIAHYWMMKGNSAIEGSDSDSAGV